MLGFVIEHEITHRTYNLTRAAEAIEYLPEDMIPVYRTMAENYVVFDRWFCDVPGPTNPNRYAHHPRSQNTLMADGVMQRVHNLWHILWTRKKQPHVQRLWSSSALHLPTTRRSQHHLGQLLQPLR